MKKRGTVSLEALVKFIPHFLITVTLIAVLVTLFDAFFVKDIQPADRDFRTITDELKDLGPGDIFIVPLRGSNYIVDLYGEGAGEAPQGCGGKACVCKDRKDCKIYDKFEIKTRSIQIGTGEADKSRQLQSTIAICRGLGTNKKTISIGKDASDCNSVLT